MVIAERDNPVGHCPTHGWNLDDGKDGEGDDGTASDQVTQHLMMSTSTKLPPKTTNCHQKQQHCHQKKIWHQKQQHCHFKQPSYHQKQQNCHKRATKLPPKTTWKTKKTIWKRFSSASPVPTLGTAGPGSQCARTHSWHKKSKIVPRKIVVAWTPSKSITNKKL